MRNVPISEALRFWLKLGFISFGGPAGQIAIMHQELVERRRWISEGRFLHALNYCMLLPGPEAQQLATYIGWLLHRTRGGLVAGCCSSCRRFFILVALSWLYVSFGKVPAVAAVLLRHETRGGGHRAPSRPGAWAVACCATRLLAAIAVLAFVALTLFSRAVSLDSDRRRAGRCRGCAPGAAIFPDRAPAPSVAGEVPH